MGRHVIDIDMVGGHGCDRNAKEGEPLAARCGKRYLDATNSGGCPDCAIAAFVEFFKTRGAFTHGGHATFTHWPGEAG